MLIQQCKETEKIKKYARQNLVNVELLASSIQEI